MANNQQKNGTSNYEQEIVVPGYLRASKIIAYIVYAWTALGIGLLSLRVFLLAFSANIETPFVNFIYRTSADYLSPFRGIFPSRSINETGYLDVAALFAIIMYLLAAWGIGQLINYVQLKIDTAKYNQKMAIITNKRNGGGRSSQ